MSYKETATLLTLHPSKLKVKHLTKIILTMNEIKFKSIYVKIQDIRQGILIGKTEEKIEKNF